MIMSRIQRALRAASISAVSLSTLTLTLSFIPVGVTAASATGPAGGSAAVYVVKPGDFLAGIAAKVGVALPELLTANGMTAKSLILPGDKLELPSGATAPGAATPSAVAAGALTYTVKFGDFLLGIATSYKVTLADLLAVNNLTIKSLIVPGRQLALPASAVAPVVAASAPPTAGSGTATVAASSLTYTVKFGDFLAGIASKYRVKLDDLLNVNNLKASSLILPGAQLAMPTGAVAPVVAPVVTPAHIQTTAGPADVVVAYAYAQLGKPYRFFTDGPDTFDCSGLVKAAYAQIGMVLIHHSASQATLGTAVDIWSEPIQAGDLIFMATHGGPEITHVGIAVDATHWIHAPKPGDVVRLAPIPPKGIITTVRRLIP
jgi:LysM repeat protein